jgi:hypothetical protein
MIIGGQELFFYKTLVIKRSADPLGIPVSDRGKRDTDRSRRYPPVIKTIAARAEKQGCDKTQRENKISEHVKIV